MTGNIVTKVRRTVFGQKFAEQISEVKQATATDRVIFKTANGQTVKTTVKWAFDGNSMLVETDDGAYFKFHFALAQEKKATLTPCNSGGMITGDGEHTFLKSVSVE